MRRMGMNQYIRSKSLTGLAVIGLLSAMLAGIGRLTPSRAAEQPSAVQRTAREAVMAPPSGSDVPMINYGYPYSTTSSKSPFCCYGAFNSAALANPDAGTLVVQLDWSDVEPSQGTFDFTPADHEVAAAVEQGKKVALVLRFQAGYVATGSSGSCDWTDHTEQLLPQWVGTALGASDSFCSHGTGLTIPKYWGSTFIGLWKAYVDAVAAHFAPDASSIAYVRAPVGMGDEAKAITGPNSVPLKGDVKSLDSWGYTPQLWEAWQEDMLAYYQRTFSYAPWVLYTINKQDVNKACSGAAHESIPTFVTVTVPCSHRAVEVDVGEWAVDHGFGLAQNSLASLWIFRNPSKADPPAGQVKTVLKYALSHTPHPFVELQPYQALSTFCNLNLQKILPKCVPNSNAIPDTEDDISYARAHGVGAIEWYEADLADPTMKSVMDLWRQLAQIPGRGKLRTVVSLHPSTSSAAPRAKIQMTVDLGVPSITGFVPGGTLQVMNDLTHHLLKSVQIAPNVGQATLTIRIPKTKAGHISLRASYLDRFTLAGHPSATELWKPSSSKVVRVAIKK